MVDYKAGAQLEFC